MKAIRHMTKQERKAMNAEIRKRCVEVSNQYELDYDTMAIYILHFYYGFGEKRLIDYHRHLVQERNELKEFYESDDKDPDIHFFAMRSKLKEKGIDVEAIRDLVMGENEKGGNT